MGKKRSKNKIKQCHLAATLIKSIILHLLVDAIGDHAGWHDARPGNAEAVMLQTHGGHHRYVVLEAGTKTGKARTSVDSFDVSKNPTKTK